MLILTKPLVKILLSTTDKYTYHKENILLDFLKLLNLVLETCKNLVVQNIGKIFIKSTLHLDFLHLIWDKWLPKPIEIQFVIPPTRTQNGDEAFAVAGPSIWNTIPRHIRDSPNTDSFKKVLKTYLFPSQ